MRTTRRLAATLTLLAALTACQPPAPETPTATVAVPTTSPPSAATPTPSLSPTPSPSLEDYAIPPVIDEPYVQRILTALYDLESEAVRQMVAAQEVTPEAEALVRAANRSSVVDRDLDSYRADASEGFTRVLQHPGYQQVTLDKLISVQLDCVFAQVTREFEDVLVDPDSADGQTFVQLLPKPEDQEFSEQNPTPWIIGGSVLRTDGSRPENPCA